MTSRTRSNSSGIISRMRGTVPKKTSSSMKPFDSAVMQERLKFRGLRNVLHETSNVELITQPTLDVSNGDQPPPKNLLGLTTRGTPRIREIRRKKSDMPAPSLPSNAEVNQLNEKYQARVSRGVNAMVDQFRETSGLTKKQVTEQALKQFVDNYPFPK